MGRYFLILLVFCLTACSSKPEKTKTSEVDSFVKEWIADYQPETKKAEIYTRYLHTVEDLYQKHSQEGKFTQYLKSLNNMNQLIGHADFNMSYRFKREKGRHASPRSKEFLLYREKNLEATKNRLSTERETKIKTEVGGDFFQLLYQNLILFKKNNAGVDFPL